MKRGASGSFGAHLKAHREAAGFTQEELAAIAGLSVQAVGALERGERRRPHLETVRALSAALDLNRDARDALIASARAPAHTAAADELGGVALPVELTNLVGRDADVQALRQWLGDGVRLITLVGPGGVGKTRLALEVTRGVAEDGAPGMPLPNVRGRGLPTSWLTIFSEWWNGKDVHALVRIGGPSMNRDTQPPSIRC